MEHVYLRGTSNHTFVLLHGTGGDEYDLINIAKQLDESAHILSLRGRIIENGHNRFFKRHKAGVFDQESLENESNYLHSFLKELLKRFLLNKSIVTVLGYSNGANIALNLLLNYSFIFNNAILLRPMPVSDNIKNKQLETNIFIGAGKNDPLTTTEKTEIILQSFNSLNANVALNYYNIGHSICNKELSDVKKWLELFK